MRSDRGGREQLGYRESFDKIIRSVQAFGRGLSGSGSQARPASIAGHRAGARRRISPAASRILAFSKSSKKKTIPISLVAGTSVGALIGAAYCSGVTVPELELIATRVRFKHFARWTSRATASPAMSA